MPSTVSHIDHPDGFREDLLFLDTTNGMISAGMCSPDGGSDLGAVICPPLFNEIAWNFRREVYYGRMLAAAGIAACRFVYRGSGNSDGMPEDTTFDTMCEDARRAIRHLTERAGAQHIALVGTRAGALVAAACAPPGATLVLVEPVIQGRRYFKEGFRAKTAATLAKGGEGAAGPGDHRAELLERGRIDVLGTVLGRGLYESVHDLELVSLLDGDPMSILLVELGDPDEPHGRPIQTLAESLRTAGHDVDTLRSGKPKAWWFIDDLEDRPMARPGEVQTQLLRDPIAEEVTRWLSSRHRPA